MKVWFVALHCLRVPNAAQFMELLKDLQEGKKRALDELMPMVYSELHRMADNYLRQERSGHTLQPTALVHEAYLRLIGQHPPDYQNRAHFCGVAAQVMRQILVDHARRRNAVKRGGGGAKIPLNEDLDYGFERASELVALDDALSALAVEDPEKARLVELRFFGGLTGEESSEVTGLPPQTIYRQLRVAQAWLRRELDKKSK
jgi:RNA polymerase sigma factor (TIGR02999 family)